jgi:hypothetical protein
MTIGYVKHDMSIKKLDDGNYQIIISESEIIKLTDDLYNIKEHMIDLHALTEFESRISHVVSEEES